MLFEQEKYYKYISTIEKTNTFIYIVIMIIATVIGIATGVATLILTIPIGILIANMYTFNSKIKAQKMKMEIDMYNKIMQNQNKEVVY